MEGGKQTFTTLIDYGVLFTYCHSSASPASTSCHSCLPAAGTSCIAACLPPASSPHYHSQPPLPTTSTSCTASASLCCHFPIPCPPTSFPAGHNCHGGVWMAGL